MGHGHSPSPPLLSLKGQQRGGGEGGESPDPFSCPNFRDESKHQVINLRVNFKSLFLHKRFQRNLEVFTGHIYYKRQIMPHTGK